MNTFEDDAINDDFELEITDLDPGKETRPISSTIASLRSRISFNTHRNDSDDTSLDDDFELEITDLPAISDDEDRRARFIAAIADVSALRSRISLSPRSEEPSDEVANDDFRVEITDLPTSDDNMVRRGRFIAPSADVSAFGRLITHLGSLHSRLPRKVRMLRLATVGIAILLMLGVVLESVPSARDAVLSLLPRPTPTPPPASVTREFTRFGGYDSGIILGGGISISSAPIAGVTVIPWNPNTPVSTVLGPVPQACPSANVPQDPDSIDFPYDNRVGGPPLWIMGFQGAPAKLIGFARANPPQYGWVRQILLMLESDADGPVMLQGGHLLDETPLLFSDRDSQQSPTTFLTLNLDSSSISNSDADVQWGIQAVSLYIPAAGCYYLKASWAGGSWEVLFAAGQ